MTPAEGKLLEMLRPPMSDAEFEARILRLKHSRTQAADIARLHLSTLSNAQILRLGKALCELLPDKNGRLSPRVTNALKRVGELIAAGMSAKATRDEAAKEFGCKAESLRKARTRRAARLRT